ncbi:MAG: hypothetical protein ACOC8N_04465 [Spirochaetota bacterium]
MYAVVTGDLVKSELFIRKRKQVLDLLNTALRELEDVRQGEVWVSDIHRGDAFQIVTNDAEQALRIALFMRARLMQHSVEGRVLEARLAVGIGGIQYLDRNNMAESDGQAFRLSGRSLEEMTPYRRLVMSTSDEELNRVLQVVSALIDAVSARWSREQAAAVSHWVFGGTQAAVADALGISQPAVHQRLQRAGHFALDICLKQFKSVVGYYKLENK